MASAFESLDKRRVLGVGAVFALAFTLSTAIGIGVIFSNLQQLVGPFAFGVGPRPSGLGAGRFLLLLILGLIPVASIAVASALARKVLRAEGSIEGDVFIAGASLLPFGIFVLLTGLLGLGNAEVVAVLAVFALCYTILTIYAGCTRIPKISEASAALAVPVMLLVSAWLTR